MLYPYRPSAIKNRQRWNFGVLYPSYFCERQSGPESSGMQTECLVRTTAFTQLHVKVRFLQIVRRTVGLLRTPGKEEPEGVEPDFQFVNRLEVGGRVYQPWQEAVEREFSQPALDPTSLNSLSPGTFSFSQQKTFEYLRDEQGQAIGVIVRDWESLQGSVEFDSVRVHDGIIRVTVRVINRKNVQSISPHELTDRETVLLDSLISAHTILGVEHGEFISLLEPPTGLEHLITQCKNVGTWPVLAGDGTDTVLSSPIILYDHPRIAPESAGNLFDLTEIDEILSLRILTLTDDEKREIRQGDERARQILERTENMPDEQMMKLHGVLRGLTPHKEEMR
jgi:hydrogenase maturation protease